VKPFDPAQIAYECFGGEMMVNIFSSQYFLLDKKQILILGEVNIFQLMDVFEYPS
jgi:hypothetical protein